MITFLINAFKIIFVLGFLVLIHEGGHFLVAKFFKVKVNEFSIGFGKKIWSKQKGETQYSIRMVPFGGYVSMLGEEEKSDDDRSFSQQSILKRIAIVAAGGIVNIVFGLMVYFLLITCIGNFASRNVESVVQNYAAEQAGILPGDEIIEANGKHVFITKDLNSELSKAGSDKVSLKVKRNNEERQFEVYPTEVKSKSIGIYLDSNSNQATKISYMYEDSPAKGILETGDIILEANGEDVKNNYEKLLSIIDNAESNLLLKVDRKGEQRSVTIQPKEYSNYYLGVTFKIADKDLFTRLYYGFFETGNFALSLIDNVKSLFTGRVSVDQMMGPIGISKTVADTNNFYDFIYLMALISLSLGITNLLPFPALDGGKIFILLIEAIRRKPMKENTEILIQMVGFSLIILLSIYISYIDVTRFF
ncbi:MAG: RIP metalloprotease RseP [Clostridia bacterium]|nr:RIP metalloprotease RseP [Clostridia bacterium]